MEVEAEEEAMEDPAEMELLDKTAGVEEMVELVVGEETGVEEVMVEMGV